MQKVYKKLPAHPLFISDYVVYYARVARTFILVSLLCVCVCVTLLFGSAKQKLLKVEIFLFSVFIFTPTRVIVLMMFITNIGCKDIKFCWK